jgi:hypothetical protein
MKSILVLGVTVAHTVIMNTASTIPQSAYARYKNDTVYCTQSGSMMETVHTVKERGGNSAHSQITR